MSEHDVPANPTLDTVLGDRSVGGGSHSEMLDFDDPALLGALEGCSTLLPEL